MLVKVSTILMILPSTNNSDTLTILLSLKMGGWLESEMLGFPGSDALYSTSILLWCNRELFKILIDLEYGGREVVLSYALSKTCRNVLFSIEF